MYMLHVHVHVQICIHGHVHTTRHTIGARAAPRVRAPLLPPRSRAAAGPEFEPPRKYAPPSGRWRGGRESGAHAPRVRRAAMQHDASLGLRSAVSSSGPVGAVLRPVVVQQSAPETQAECVRRAPGRCAVCRDMGGRGGEMGNRSGKEARSRKGRAWLVRARAVAH